MYDLAKTLGVSVSTVSLALRGHEVVAPSTRARVLDEARRLGYVYNRAAANLRTKSSNVVGFVVPDITNPFAAEVALGLQDALMPVGQFVALANTRDDVVTQTGILQTFLEQRVAGIVLIPSVETHGADLVPLRQSGTPVVTMNRVTPQSDLPFVGTDDEAIVELALEHLTAVHGVRVAAYFGGLPSASPLQARRKQFLASLVRRGMSNEPSWSVPCLPNSTSAYETARSTLMSTAPPEALICHSDSIAVGLLRALSEAGLRRCVVGIDGIDGSSMTVPSLTTVDVHPVDMGAAAGRLLLSLSSSPRLPAPLPHPSLVVRESCGCQSVNREGPAGLLVVRSEDLDG